ncbi:MAG: hypothetical protein NTU76_02355 [Candidatus Taylorbacteria bacterium]|nr:hypothetical protein [Candidatus Taylorbacteria bacterium]
MLDKAPTDDMSQTPTVIPDVENIGEKGTEESSALFRKFPGFFSEPQNKSLYEDGNYSEKNIFMLEYFKSKVVETDNFIALVMDYAERGYVFNETAAKVLKIVFRRKDGWEEKTIKESYWIDDGPKSGMDWGQPRLLIEDKGSDKFIVSLLGYEKDTVNARFEVDLSKKAEIEKIA